MTRAPLMEKISPIQTEVVEDDDDMNCNEDIPTTCFPRLKKIDTRKSIETPRGRFSFLPNRKPVDINFKALTYSVTEGMRKGWQRKCFFF